MKKVPFGKSKHFLSNQDIRDIRQSANKAIKAIATKYNSREARIWYIINRKTWPYVYTQLETGRLK